MTLHGPGGSDRAGWAFLHPSAHPVNRLPTEQVSRELRGCTAKLILINSKASYITGCFLGGIW